LAEIFWLTLFLLCRVRYIAAIKFNSLPASGAHSSVDIPGVIGKRSIKIVFFRGHSFPQGFLKEGTRLEVSQCVAEKSRIQPYR
jgi:hypothetical protein